jgi:hypothetical protein
MAFDDGVMAIVDVGTAGVTQSTVSADVTPAPVIGNPRVIQARGTGVIPWLTREADQGEINMDGDGVPSDVMVAYVRPAVSTTPVLNVLGGANAILTHDAARIYVSVLEAQEGPGGTDRNFDLDGIDTVFGYVDLSAGPPFDAGQWSFYPLASNPGSIAFREDAAGFFGMHFAEAQQGLIPASLNFAPPPFDLDTVDTHIVTFLAPVGAPGPELAAGFAGTLLALPAGTATAVGPVSAFDVTQSGNRVGYYLDEAANGAVSANADVDATDLVPTLWDQTTQTRTILSTGPGIPTQTLNGFPANPVAIYDGTKFFFTAGEEGRTGLAAGSNNDGDGGIDTALLFWVDHTTANGIAGLATHLGVTFAGTPITGLALDGGGFVRELTAGWLAVGVNEVANGGAIGDINGTGVIDFAYLLVDTTTTPPTVHQPASVNFPGIVPFDSTLTGGTIPRWGIADTQGVVVQVRELDNGGNLDGDGQVNEILLAYVSFANPGVLLPLDVGGDHCAMAGGLIGVTAREAYTFTDYDGSGVATDVLFRVLDTTGAVMESGLPCALTSIPAVDDGTLWAYLRDEQAEGRNLNAGSGDVDMTDLVLGVWRP